MKKAVLFVVLFGIVRTVSASADPPAGEAGESQTYKVRRGDRLSEVAARYGLSEEELLAANPQSAYGVVCGNPLTVPLANGRNRAICGRPRPYLIAGKTLVIPVSRLSIETENVRLGAEVATLQGEMAELQRERESEKSELGALQQERDDLRSENKTLVAEKAELQGKYDEAQRMNQRLRSDYAERDSKNNAVMFLAVLAFALIVILPVTYTLSPGRKLRRRERQLRHERELFAEQMRRDEERLVAEQKALAEERVEFRKQKQEAEKAAQELAENQAATARDRETIIVESRANVSYGDDLDARDKSLKRVADELDQRDEALRTRNGELNGREAAIEHREDQVKAGEEGLKRGRDAIAHDWDVLHRAERDLEAREAEVDAKLRTAKEDLPVLEQQKADLAARTEVVRTREVEVAHLQDQLAQQESKLTRLDYEVRRRRTDAEDLEQVLARRREDVERRERACALAELPGVRAPHKPTLPPPFVPPLQSCGGDRDDQDGEDTVVLPDPDRKAGSSGTTSAEEAAHDAESVGTQEKIHSEPPMTPTQTTCVGVGGGEVPLTSPEAHLGTCTPPKPAGDELRETGPLIPVASQPMSSSESSFWCSLCNKDIPMGEMEAHHDLHRGQDKPGPLS